ncbi:MAG: amino acid permease [Clostridia bacterium]|nr:amino acid permease [Clostridia bacterium]
MERALVRTITLPEGVSLYVGAVVGAGVLILPGVAASMAGPASLVAWTFNCLAGIPLALTFAALAARFPDAGGVATYTAKAFGPAWGAIVGWLYFVAAATGQVIVPLTGAYYAADALNLRRDDTFLWATAILGVAVVSNLRGLKVSGRVQLALSAAVAGLLLGAALASLPRLSLAHLTPFDPRGMDAVGHATVLIFVAVFGWEAIAQLSSEFRNPERDVPRSTIWSVGLITVLYLGVALATVGTGTYGDPELDRVAVARLLADGLGIGARLVAAVMALVIALGTANAFVAATSRLGYALARDDAFPAWLGVLDRRGVPGRAVLAVGACAAGGLALTYLTGRGAENLLVIPASLGITTYVIGAASGVRLLTGPARWMATASLVLCLVALPFAGASVSWPLLVAIFALGYRLWRRGRQRLRGARYSSCTTSSEHTRSDASTSGVGSRALDGARETKRSRRTSSGDEPGGRGAKP